MSSSCYKIYANLKYIKNLPFLSPFFVLSLLNPIPQSTTTSLYLPMNYHGGQTAGLASLIRFNTYIGKALRLPFV